MRQIRGIVPNLKKTRKYTMDGTFCKKTNRLDKKFSQNTEKQIRKHFSQYMHISNTLLLTKTTTIMKPISSFLVLALAATAASAQKSSCQTSEDCSGDGFYCAQGTCRKVSKCSTRDDCLNPANSPYALAFCVGYVDCLEEQCQMVCGPEECPNGAEYSPCEPNSLPCDVTRCGQDASGCYNDPCGNTGCAPVFFNAAGNRTCIPDDDVPTPYISCTTDDECGENNYCASNGECLEVSKCSKVKDCFNPANSPFPVVACEGEMRCTEGSCGMECGVQDSTTNPSTCATDKECADGSYCAAGECLEVQQCKTREDCFNPSNGPYAVIECTGYLDCLEGGCGVVCDAVESCPPGLDWVSCDPNALPCDVETCDKAVSCQNDNCGGCHAIFFDASGSQVCDTGLIGVPVNAAACASDEACGENKYCASSGECLEVSKCSEVEDCSNPANSPFAVALCVGNMACLDGACGMICGPEVDTTSPSNTLSCTNDAECGDESYCAAGTCLAISQCNQLVDCMNPANGPYAVVACVGFLECTGTNQCGITCSNTSCADGSEPVACVANPCDVETCEGAVSCVADYCGGCNAIFFDASGNQVCATPTAGTQAPSVIDGTCTKDADCISSVTAHSRSSPTDVGFVNEQYCSQGVCTSMGSCSSDLDCFNPSNVYATKLCTGFITCSQGLCDVVCGPSCPDGNEGSDCSSRTCDIVNCPGSVSCSTDLCNDCFPTYFDAAGFERLICPRDEGKNDEEGGGGGAGGEPTLYESSTAEAAASSEAKDSSAASTINGHSIAVTAGWAVMGAVSMWIATM
jgi:hypothetical protein